MKYSLFSRQFKNLSMLSLALILVGCASQSQKNITQAVVSERSDHPLQHVEKKLLGYYTDWRGTPYRLGGNSRKGIDCSAFVKNAYQSVFAVQVPRTTLGLATIGKSVKKTELVPGDLVLFKTSRSVRHVGVVVNGNKFMHVSEKNGVMISALDNVYWRKKYWKAVRPENGIIL